jgi:hypothetical protein
MLLSQLLNYLSNIVRIANFQIGLKQLSADVHHLTQKLFLFLYHVGAVSSLLQAL